MKSFKLLIGCLVLAGCDAPKPAEPVPTPAPVAAAPTPPPASEPLLPAEALTAVPQPVLCGLFARAASDATVKVPGKDCTVTPGTTDITIASKDGAHTLSVALAVAGATIDLSQANASPRALADPSGGFRNFGFLFIARADAADLCLYLNYRAPDGKSNSLFIGGDPSKKPIRFDLDITKGAFATKQYPDPIAKAGKIRAFAITRREDGTVLKSVSFKAC